MADGGQTVDQWDLVELAARRLARAFGTGYGWRPDVNEAVMSGPGREVAPLSSALAISRRGQVTEGAAKSVGGSGHVRRQQQWMQYGGVVAVPSYRLDSDALAALSFAKLDGPLEAILLLYATGHVNRYWPTVKRFGLVAKPGRFVDEGLTDAIQRILVGRAAISQDDRARQLHVRALTYRAVSQQCEALFRRWLIRASVGFINAIMGV